MCIGTSADIHPFLQSGKEGLQHDLEARKTLRKAQSAGNQYDSAYRLLHGVLFYVDDRGRHRVYVPDYNDLLKQLLYEFACVRSSWLAKVLPRFVPALVLAWNEKCCLRTC